MKSEVRIEALKKRKLLNCGKLSKRIIDNLFSLNEYKKSKNVICYYPLEYEADTKKCFEDKSKNWFLPKVNGKFLDICPLGCLEKGYCGILEPQTIPISDYTQIDLIIIPACAADKKGYRLGYGKGYYDRFLNNLPTKCKKIVLVYSDCIYDSVYPEKYDVKADIIISDKEILRI